MQLAFMERIEKECLLRLSQAEKLLENPEPADETVKDVENSTAADSLKQLPLRSANEQVNEWLSHQSKEPTISSKAKTRSAKSKSRSSSHLTWTKSSYSTSSVVSVSHQVQVVNIFKECLSRQLQLIQSVMETDDTDFLRSELSNLDKMYTSFTDSYTRLLELTQDVGRIPDNLQDIAVIDAQVFDTKKRICSQLSQ